MIHLFCAWKLRSLREPAGGVAPRNQQDPVGTKRKNEPEGSGFQVLKREPYLQGMAALVLLGALSKILLDYVFKAQATAIFLEAEDLLRFFAVFYTVIGLITFMIQTVLSRYSLERLGLAKTVATLPSVVVAGALGVLFFPGRGSAAEARAGEGVLRSSLFRSGYELLYTPVPPQQKRATKSIIDVGFKGFGVSGEHPSRLSPGRALAFFGR
ncbi:MAG: Npt1/Npt2 family nucleotide transporter [Acidobacteriota bacterium]|nr:Npt1/Npt2 family nucleotide transporter [Acidobacteriota bacterium]